jgi:hypothetical protein
MGGPDGKIGTFGLMWEDPESLVWTFEPNGEITENGFTREECGAMVERRALCGLNLEDESDGSGIHVGGGWRFDETGAAVAYSQALFCTARAQALGLGVPAGLLDRYGSEGRTYAFGFGMMPSGPGPFGLANWLINHKDTLFRCRQ